MSEQSQEKPNSPPREESPAEGRTPLAPDLEAALRDAIRAARTPPFPQASRVTRASQADAPPRPGGGGGLIEREGVIERSDRRLLREASRYNPEQRK